MTNLSETRQQIRTFGDTYQYDAGYLLALHDASPGAYAAFAAGMSMSSFRETLPLDAHYVARISAMQADDCGPCAQLNLRMAVEAGVDRALLRTLIEHPDQLSAELQDVREHALAVCRGPEQDDARADRIRAHYGGTRHLPSLPCASPDRGSIPRPSARC